MLAPIRGVLGKRRAGMYPWSTWDHFYVRLNCRFGVMHYIVRVNY